MKKMNIKVVDRSGNPDSDWVEVERVVETEAYTMVRFITKHKYVDAVVVGKGAETSIIFYEEDGNMVRDFMFDLGRSWDTSLVVPLKHKYRVYFFHSLWNTFEANVEIVVDKGLDGE